MALFIVDTNFFIQSHRITYPLGFAEGFWKKVVKIANENKIISVDKVKNEIYENDDELKKWMDVNLIADFFKPTDTSEVLTCYAKVVNWANSKNDFYLPKAIAEFLDFENADAWLIAYALSLHEEFYIITQEKSEPNRKSKIKIPEVCNAFNIQYKNIIEMFRELGETF
ncbi:MAG: DUF4411 family protein [Actinobacteria bacterium]|nr:DUF4411 family protein [Actinomycetota bacterium]